VLIAGKKTTMQQIRLLCTEVVDSLRMSISGYLTLEMLMPGRLYYLAGLKD
jgi:hypothetical protein